MAGHHYVKAWLIHVQNRDTNQKFFSLRVLHIYIVLDFKIFWCLQFSYIFQSMYSICNWWSFLQRPYTYNKQGFLQNIRIVFRTFLYESHLPCEFWTKCPITTNTPKPRFLVILFTVFLLPSVFLFPSDFNYSLSWQTWHTFCSKWHD